MLKARIALITLVLFIAVSIMLISCGQKKAKWKGTIEEEDGFQEVKRYKVYWDL